MQDSLQFSLPTEIKFGIGVAGSVGEEAMRFAAKKALIVADKGIIKAGLVDKVRVSLKASNIEVLIFDELQPEPTTESPEKGQDRTKSAPRIRAE